MKVIKFVVICSLIFIIQSCAVVRSSMYDRIDNWEQYQFERVRNYQDFVDFAEQQKDHNIIGQVTYGELNYDIYEITINNNAKEDILIFGGVHGDEIAGVTSSMDFITNYIGQYTKDYNYIVVPIVNPWGFEFNIRYNGVGIDINRDFSVDKFDTQEAKIIFNRYKNSNPYIVIDNHEDNYLADNYFFIYDRTVKKILTLFTESNSEYKLNNDLKYFLYKTKNGINHIDKNILWLVDMSDRLTLSNYFMKYTDNVIVIESGTHNVPLEIRNGFHLDSMDFIINNF